VELLVDTAVYNGDVPDLTPAEAKAGAQALLVLGAPFLKM
jgi:hypothetical protein